MKLELELSVREQCVIALLLSVGIVVDLWLGILMILSWALDILMHFLDDGTVSTSYYSVMGTHLFVSAALLPATTYLMRNHAWGNRMDDADGLIPDRSDDDRDGRDSAHGLGGSLASEFGPYPFDGGKPV